MLGSSAARQAIGGIPAHGRRRLVRAVELLAMVFAVNLGGVSATSLFPTTVQTDHYSAAVRLSAIPTFTSTIHSPTSFGDLDLEFDSFFLAPGVDATVQVRDTITELFDDRRVSIETIQPSSKEISDALGAGVTELGLKFSGGVLVVGIGAIALIAYARRRRPTPRQFVSTGIAGLVSIGVTGVGILGTYQPSQLSSFRTTGLLGTVRSNAGLLAGVEARAEQVTPYVRNLLALSQALQEKFVPEVNQPQAARFLLVSDIHGANQYPVMKRVIDDEQVSAVIDTGDLVNFGSVTEAEVSGIFTSIGKLGVPYVFVRGNHDANSPADQGLLQRLAKIPNVVLLEPTPQSFIEVKIHGVVIAGFNDPRYFGDDNKNNNQKQQPAAEAFNRAYAGRPRPDIVVAHEPGAVRLVDSATLRVNGHMHKSEIEGNRITVGTFTGGGVVSHFLLDKQGVAGKQRVGDKQGTAGNQAVPDKQGVPPKQQPVDVVRDESGEPVGEPTSESYAFDIAVFSQSCDLASLTRYTYRNMIQGRPAFDDVRVVSGKTIATREPGPRTCAANLGTVRTTVTLGG